MSNTAVLESLEAKWKQDPQSRVFFRFADELRKAQQFDRAIEVCQSGLEHHTQYLPAMICLARCYEQKQKYTEASELYKRVLAQDPGNQHALNGMSIALEDQSDYQGALQFAESLALIQPSDELEQRIQSLQVEVKRFDENQSDSSTEIKGNESTEETNLLHQEIENKETQALADWQSQSTEITPESDLNESDPSFNTLPTVQLDATDYLVESANDTEEEPYELVDDETNSEENAVIPMMESPSAVNPIAAVEANHSHHRSGEKVPVEPLSTDLADQGQTEIDLIDAEFEQSLTEDSSETLMELESLSSGSAESKLPNDEVEIEITRALKHEKMEHYEEAISIYQRLLRHASDLNQIQRNIDRVEGMLDNETIKSRKIRNLNIWLEKIKGVYHVS